MAHNLSMNVLMETIIEFLSKLVPNDYLLITIASAFPLVELKGGILLGISKHLSPLLVFLLCYIGSSIVAPIILLLLRPILNLLKKIPVVNKLAVNAEAKFNYKADKMRLKSRLDKNGQNKINIYPSLFIFVALPLPMTGVWTGAAIACFLNVDYLKSLAIILIGNLTAGLIVFAIAMLFEPYANLIFGLFLLIIVIVAIISIIYTITNHLKTAKKSS